MPGRVRKIKTRVLDRKRYYTTIKYPEIPLSVDDFYVITTIGDRLDNLANQFYEDVNLWWVITSANPDIIKRDSFMLLCDNVMYDNVIMYDKICNNLKLISEIN